MERGVYVRTNACFGFGMSDGARGMREARFCSLPSRWKRSVVRIGRWCDGGKCLQFGIEFLDHLLFDLAQLYVRLGCRELQSVDCGLQRVELFLLHQDSGCDRRVHLR